MTPSSIDTANAPIRATIPGSGEVPQISSTTATLFKENFLQVPKSLMNLKGKVEGLEKIQIGLIDVRENSTTRKVISVLITTVSVALIASVVLGLGGTCILLGVPELVLLIPFLSLFLFYPLGTFCDMISSDCPSKLMDNLEYAYPLVIIIMGPFLPVWREFRRVSQYQEQIATQTTQIREDLEETKNFFTQNKQAVENLRSSFLETQSQLDKNLENTRKLPVQFPDAEKKLVEVVKRVEKGLQELEEIVKFCDK